MSRGFVGSITLPPSEIDLSRFFPHLKHLPSPHSWRSWPHLDAFALSPIVPFVTGFTASGALAAIRPVRVLTNHAIPDASLAVLAPVVSFVAGLTASGAFAASPFVGVRSGRTTSRTFFAVLAPVVFLVAGLAASGALAAMPLIKTNQTKDIQTSFHGVKFH